MSYVKGEIDIELLQLQAALEQELSLGDKSSEYLEGFLAGCQMMIAYAKALYQLCDGMANKKGVDND